MGDLQVLEAELITSCGQPSERARERAERLRATPLLHCVRRPRDLSEIVEQACLLSRRQRRVKPPQNRSELELGLDDHVYASVGYLYLPATIALIFRPAIEDARVEATPWDTGTFTNVLTRSWSANERRRIHAHYSLPAPQYRSYLVACAAVLFSDPAEYITGGPLNRQVPPILDRQSRLAWTFEARFPQRIATSATNLQAVFLDQAENRTLPAPVKAWLEDLARAAVVVRSIVTTFDPLQLQVERYLLGELGLGS